MTLELENWRWRSGGNASCLGCSRCTGEEHIRPNERVGNNRCEVDRAACIGAIVVDLHGSCFDDRVKYCCNFLPGVKYEHEGVSLDAVRDSSHFQTLPPMIHQITL